MACPRCSPSTFGVHTGVALRRHDGSRAWHTWGLAGAGCARLNKLTDRLAALHDAERFVRVGYEQPFGGPGLPTIRA